MKPEAGERKVLDQALIRKGMLRHARYIEQDIRRMKRVRDDLAWLNFRDSNCGQAASLTDAMSVLIDKAIQFHKQELAECISWTPKKRKRETMSDTAARARKFTKKPVTVTAYQITRELLESILFDGEVYPRGLSLGRATYHAGDRKIDYWRGVVVTIHGQKTGVVEGDWIIAEPDGTHFYPCKPDIFEANYLAAQSAPVELKADTLFGVYCSGNPESIPKDRAIFWEGWQRVADYANGKFRQSSAPVGEVARDILDGIRGKDCATDAEHNYVKHILRHHGYGAQSPEQKYEAYHQNNWDWNLPEWKDLSEDKKKEWTTTTLRCPNCGSDGKELCKALVHQVASVNCKHCGQLEIDHWGIKRHCVGKRGLALTIRATTYEPASPVAQLTELSVPIELPGPTGEGSSGHSWVEPLPANASCGVTQSGAGGEQPPELKAFKRGWRSFSLLSAQCFLVDCQNCDRDNCDHYCHKATRPSEPSSPSGQAAATPHVHTKSCYQCGHDDCACHGGWLHEQPR